MSLVIQQAVQPGEIEEARNLILEYVASLNISLAFQNYDAELAGLPGKYAPPKGALLLAMVDGQATGCVALRPLEEGICEMKRLYVRPAFRGLKLGRKLGDAIIVEGKRIGYRAMRLDTLETLKPALALYESLGFQVIPAYYHNPTPGVIFMEVEL